MPAALPPLFTRRFPAARAAALAVSRAMFALAAVCCVSSSIGCAHAPTTFDRRVLVMDFQNLIPQDAAPKTPSTTSQLASSLADLLTADLANHPKISVVERSNNPALIGLGWQEAGLKAKVDYVIVGSLSKLNENYVVAIRLLSMATGEVVKGSSVERSCNREEDLYPVVTAMGNVMAEHLQVLSERYEAWVQQPKGSPPAGAVR